MTKIADAPRCEPPAEHRWSRWRWLRSPHGELVPAEIWRSQWRPHDELRPISFDRATETCWRYVAPCIPHGDGGVA